MISSRQRRTDFSGIVGTDLNLPSGIDGLAVNEGRISQVLWGYQVLHQAATQTHRQRRTDFSGIVGVTNGTGATYYSTPSTKDGFLRYCGSLCLEVENRPTGRQRRTDFSGIVGKK